MAPIKRAALKIIFFLIVRLYKRFGYSIVYKIEIKEELLSKARPKFNRYTGRAYHETGYKKAMRKLRSLLFEARTQGRTKREKAHQYEIKSKKPCAYFYYAEGGITPEKDLDNLIGFPLDAMVYAKVLTDDNILLVRSVHGFIHFNPHLASKVILVIMQKV